MTDRFGDNEFHETSVLGRLKYRDRLAHGRLEVIASAADESVVENAQQMVAAQLLQEWGNLANLPFVGIIHGGGSGPIKHLLHPALLKDAGDVPVLHLDSSYSRHLNREGCYIAARDVEQAAQRTEIESKKKTAA